MIRVAVCENDSFYIEKETKLIESYLNKKGVEYVISTYLTSIELISAYTDELDLIFLDVAMDNMDGIEAAKRLRGMGSKALIVFLSAYSEYSLEGYKVNAHRFLLKNDANLEESLCECIDSAIDRISIRNKRVELEVQGGTLSIVPSKIVFAESKAHKVTIHVLESSGDIREYYRYDRLDNIQDILGKFGFMRIHQSYLINGEYLRDVCRYKAEMGNDISLPISKKYYNEVEEYYIRMRGEL